MGLILTDFFEPISYEDKDTEVIVCNECLSHLCLSSLVLLDQFWGLSGDAYLVEKLINITRESEDIESSMRTGVYIINKIKCLQCRIVLGWQYKKSFKYSEYYKEGKYVIEKKYIRLITNNCTTAHLTEQAKLLKRRRSSASIASSLAEEENPLATFRSRIEADDYDFKGAIAVKGDTRRTSVSNFRDGISHLLTRTRLQSEKNDLDEHDEAADTFLES